MKNFGLLRSTKATLVLSAAAFFLFEFLLYQFADKPIELYIHDLPALYPESIGFFHNITDLGKAQWYLWPCGLAAILCAFVSRGKDVPPRYRRLFTYIGVRASFLFCAIAASGIAADILKPLLGRARPSQLFSQDLYGFFPLTAKAAFNSMPSGHTTTAFALACSLSVLYPRLRFLWFAGGILLGISRMVVEAHYLSDVAAGTVLGWGTVRLLLKYGIIQSLKVIFPIDIGRSQV